MWTHESPTGRYSPSKGNQGTTRGKDIFLLTLVGIEPTTSGLRIFSMPVKKTAPNWRDAQIASVHRNILNLSYAYLYCAYKFKLRSRFIERISTHFRVGSCCALQRVLCWSSNVPFTVHEQCLCCLAQIEIIGLRWPSGGGTYGCTWEPHITPTQFFWDRTMRRWQSPEDFNDFRIWLGELSSFLFLRSMKQYNTRWQHGKMGGLQTAHGLLHSPLKFQVGFVAKLLGDLSPN